MPGRLARSCTAAGATVRPCTTAALMLIVGVALMKAVRALAIATGSVAVDTTAVLPLKASRHDSRAVPVAARLASVFFTTR